MNVALSTSLADHVNVKLRPLCVRVLPVIVKLPPIALGISFTGRTSMVTVFGEELRRPSFVRKVNVRVPFQSVDGVYITSPDEYRATFPGHVGPEFCT